MLLPEDVVSHDTKEIKQEICANKCSIMKTQAPLIFDFKIPESKRACQKFTGKMELKDKLSIKIKICLFWWLTILKSMHTKDLQKAHENTYMKNLCTDFKHFLYQNKVIF